jgi:hypothetical protein
LLASSPENEFVEGYVIRYKTPAFAKKVVCLVGMSDAPVDHEASGGFGIGIQCVGSII